MTTTDQAPEAPPENTDHPIPAAQPGVQVEKLEHIEEALSVLPEQGEWQRLCVMARTLAMAAAAPGELRGKPADMLLVLLTARDLGIKATDAMRTVQVVKGKVTLAPRLKIALVERRGLGRVRPCSVDPRTGECPTCGSTTGNTTERATAHAFVNATGEVVSFTFTMEDAKRADIVKAGGAWFTYPQRMLWWRCLPMRAEALTPTGWVAGDKANEGDTILGFDSSSGLCRWTTVEQVHRYEAADTFIVENTRSFRATATADHEWVTDRWDKQAAWAKTTTDELAAAHSHTRLLVAAPMADTPSEITSDDAARLGWVLTDGCITWRGASPAITISQCKYVEVVRALFPTAVEDVTLTVTCPDCGSEFIPKAGPIVTRRTEHRFRLNAEESRRLLSLVGMRTKDDAPMIPAQLDNAGRQAMFDAMLLANGEQFCTGHEAVWDCWTILAAMLGIQTRPPLRQRGSLRARSRTRSDRPRTVKVSRLSVTPATTEPVWCPTTELGTWLARIDGQVTITGNCSGYLVDDVFPESSFGIYSPDEMGAMTDEDGQYIDVNAVEVPEGFGGRAGATAAEPEPLTDEMRANLAGRIAALPDEGRTALRVLWTHVNEETNKAALPALADLTGRHLVKAEAMLTSVERRADKGEWGPWPSFPSDQPEAAKTPADAPVSAPEAEDAQPPPDPPMTAQGDAGPSDEAVAAAIAHVQGIADKRQVVLELGSHGMATTGNEQSMRKRLALFYAEHPDQLPKGEGS